MGLSLARNNGVKKATGDYLLFIDSDDYVEKNLLENINKDIDDLDVLRYQLNMVLNDKIIPYGEKEFNVTNGIDAFEKIVRYKFIEMAALYVINRKYYLDNNKDAKLAKSASMTVVMSNEIEIISKTPNYSSENEFRHCVEENMMTFCLIMGGAMSTIFLIVAYLVCVIVAWISYYNKTKNLS